MTDKEFEEKFIIHRNPISSYLKFKYKISKEDIDDIVQQAFLKLYKRFGNNNLDCEFPKKYLYNTVDNCYIESVTRKKYNSELKFTDINTPSIEYFLDTNNQIDLTLTPENIIENKSIVVELKNLIQELAIAYPDAKSIFEMFYYQDMTALEVANELNIPVNTIKTKLFRGRNKLKSLINDRMVLSSYEG